MSRLYEVIAVEKAEKSRLLSRLTEILNKRIKKPDLFTGFHKHYEALNDEDQEKLPPESKRVQDTVKNVITEIRSDMTQLLDVCARREWSNCLTNARSNVVIDGSIVLEDVPVTYLLFLEKMTEHLNTLIENLPLVDPQYEWHYSDAHGFLITDETTKHRTKKEQVPIVLYDATDRHPAQTQLITKDVLVGHWKQVEHSGGIKKDDKEALLNKVNKLRNAVKEARERANDIDEAPRQNIGVKVMNYVFNDE